MRALYKYLLLIFVLLLAGILYEQIGERQDRGPEQQRELFFLSNNPRTAETEGEGCTLEQSMAEVRLAGNFGDRPLVVLTGAKPFRPPDPKYQEATDALNDYWFHQLQPRLAALSTRGHLVIEDQAEEPAAVIQAIREVVDEVRSTR
jgi:hypothetical protein